MTEVSHPADGLSRRRFLQVTAAGVTGLAAAGSTVGPMARAAAAAEAVSVGSLSVAGRFDRLLGVDDPAPLLAWRLDRGTQVAYQIRAATNPDTLEAADLWDSGWVRSSNSAGVPYAGGELPARQAVVWQVRIRDADGEVSDWSAPSTWEVGLLASTDWGAAVWIQHPTRTDADPLPILARPFTVDAGRTVGQARLYVAGLGVYVATVNGREVTDAVLCPGNSNPQQSVEVGTYDITALLAPGENTLGIQLGNGITNVVEIENPAVGREDVYTKFQSEVAEPTTLAAPVSDGATTVSVAAVDGFAVGATVNIDTGAGGADLECRIITAVDAAGPDTITIAFAEPLAKAHAAGAMVTRSGTANETTVAVSPRVLARLEVAYSDGSVESIVSDPSWRCALGPTVTDNWYSGSDYDARREQHGWDLPGADLSATATRGDGTPTGWIAAGIAPPPSLATRLTWRHGEPVTIVDTVAPVEITQPVPGTWVVDFGQNSAALFELHVDGTVPAGTVVRVQPSESLSADGTVDAGSMGSDDDIFDTYTTAGDPDGETWRPSFVHHGFQYLQVTGLPAGYDVTTETLTALHTRASTTVSGDVSTSSDLVNRLHRMSRYSIASNMQSIFTDCPNREKLGWLADMIQSIQAIDRNFKMSAFLPHMQQVMREAQLVAGPNAGLVPAHTPEFPIFDGQWAMYRDDINWGSAIILTPWWLWQRHGDTATMDRHYAAMVDYHDYVRTMQAGADGVGEHLVDGPLKDWVASDESTPGVLVGTYGYYLMTDRLAQMAAELGKDGDAQRFGVLAADIAAAFNARFFNDSLRTYTNDGNAGTTGTQAANALALDAGLVPAGSEQDVLDNLVERIYAYHPNGGGPHLSGGTISLGPTFRSLSDAGRDDVIWELLHETTRPSYGSFMLPSVFNPHGMTTVPEHWYAPERNSSLNHIILLQIDEWFSTGLAGIQHVPDAIAYEQVVVKPRLVGTATLPLTHVDGYFDGPRGRIRSAWSIAEQGSRDLSLDVTIPGNTTAQIHVPTIRPTTVRVNGRPARASREVDFESFADGYAVYSAGPGRYRITAQLP
ncbi:alpha-L-rhamnosidase [Jiangella asiatica]|uniref:alpha-L-rhamnosidase n=1 Tax=Jiangella asiatica TaxID=2530372 RepID=A0A4R5DCJ6_9ACTN|nr:alpha-L-rhamnosidase [Jiangella asiatica]TDE11472.1 hypothetical protein E1269_09400 [Jiangella asiatica]